jgi:hypothetical protein
MNLKDEQIGNFQEIYFKHFGKKIDKKEAYTKGIVLVRLFEVLCKKEFNKTKTK